MGKLMWLAMVVAVVVFAVACTAEDYMVRQALEDEEDEI